MFCVGGNAGKSNIEVHDIQFAVARTPEEAWPALREAWSGDADKIPIAGYSRINRADGYGVTKDARWHPIRERVGKFKSKQFTLQGEKIRHGGNTFWWAVISK